MGIQKLIAASFLLMASCTVLSAQQPTPAPRPRKADEPVTTGVIDGRVVNESGQGMSGAGVSVRAVNSGGAGRQTTTDSEGNFRMAGLEPALYTVSAGAPAYTPAAFADPFTPTYYRIGDTVRIELVRGGAITGTVTNAVGDPVVAVRVRATMIRDARGEGAKLPAYISSEQPTDDRGVYRIYGLRPGSYIVSAGGSGFAYNFNPYDQDQPTYAPSASRDTAAEVLVRSGEDSNIDIRYRGEPGHVISGTVKVSNTNGSSVSLTQAGSSIPLGNTFQPDGARGFTFTGLGDGDYDIVAQELASNPNNTTTPVFSVSEPKRVSIKGVDVTGIELLTKPMSSISGTIALEPSKAPECQGKRPPLFAEMVVRLQKPENDKDKEDPIMRRFLSVSSPDANGAFQLRNLVPGKYQFEPRFYARYWYLQSITTTAGTPKPQKVDAAANWTTVKSGEQLSNLTITLAQGAATIRGRVVVAEGAATPAMSLYLVPAEPDKANDVLRYFVSDVADDMTFTFNNLPPGRYLTYLDTQTITLKKLRQPEAAPERLKVRRSAETKENEIELKPCQNLVDYQLKP
jgi:hypothetical protein